MVPPYETSTRPQRFWGISINQDWKGNWWHISHHPIGRVNIDTKVYQHQHLIHPTHLIIWFFKINIYHHHFDKPSFDWMQSLLGYPNKLMNLCTFQESKWTKSKLFTWNWHWKHIFHLHWNYLCNNLVNVEHVERNRFEFFKCIRIISLSNWENKASIKFFQHSPMWYCFLNEFDNIPLEWLE